MPRVRAAVWQRFRRDASRSHGPARSGMMPPMPASIPIAIGRALQPLRPFLRVAWIHGSVARNEATPSSDIDLVVVGDVRMEALVAPLQRAGARLGRDIHPMLYRAAEFRRRHAAGNHFVRSITTADAIFVVGGRDELEEIVETGACGAAHQ